MKAFLVWGISVSYDLNFWRTKPGVKLDPQKVYERLSTGEQLEGLEDLPMPSLLARAADTFAECWERLDPQTWESSNGAFETFTMSQFSRVDCYGVKAEVMDLFFDIGLEFGCPLYDPHTGVRFEQ
jgi:hypothetical protein